MRPIASAIFATFVAMVRFAEGAAARQPEAPSAAVLIDRALQGESRYQREGARWRLVSRERREGVATLRIDGHAYGDRFHQTLTALEGDKETTLYTIVGDADSWFVQIGAGKYTRYRAYEAPLPFGNSYTMLTGAMPSFATDQTLLQRATIRMDGPDACVAHVRGEASPESLAQLNRELAELGKGDADQRRRAEWVLQPLLLRAQDIELRIDVRSGLILYDSRFGSFVVETFDWLGVAPDFQVEFPFPVPRDLRGVWEPERAFDWVASSGDPSFRPGGRFEAPSDAYLLNVKSGAVLRLPHRGAFCIPGSFSPDHGHVYVSGTITPYGPYGMWDLDLDSLRSRALHGALPPGALPICPRCSPDGKLLAVTCMNYTANLGSLNDSHKLRIALIDLATQALRPLENSDRLSARDWFPDSRSLLAVQTAEFNATKPGQSIVVRLYLDGKRVELASGLDGVVLRRKERLLYKDNATKRWMICDFHGRNAEQFGDGLKNLSIAAPAPNEESAIFIRVEKGQTPVPVRVNLETAVVSDVSHRGTGAWLMPVWR